MYELWVEKYRPTTIDEYVFRDEQQRIRVETWIKERSIPHLILSGVQGVGKTSLAKVLFNELALEDLDILVINASRENGVDIMRDKIINFVSMIPWGPFKVVLLDEADYLSPASQAILRGVMETYADTCRFVLTCNYPNRILPSIHSRCQGFHIEKIDQTEYIARVATILMDEKVNFDLDTLDIYVKVAYPDLRKCINLVQQNTINGGLQGPNLTEFTQTEWRGAAVSLFKAKNIKAARKLLCANVRPEEMEDMYSWLYQNIDMLGETEEQQDSAILIIKQGLVDHLICADSELNLAAVMVKLGRLQ